MFNEIFTDLTTHGGCLRPSKVLYTHLILPSNMG